MSRKLLEATQLNSAVTLTAVMGLFCANVIIAEGGGPLRPYEIEGMRDAAIGLITGEAPMRAAEPAYYPVRHHAFELAAATRTRVEEPLILLGEPEFVIEAPSFDDLEIIPVGSPRVLAVTDHVETPIETPRATAAANEVSANDASAPPVPRAAENSAA